MREILPGIFTWGSTYADRPWHLNGYAIRLDGCTVLVDPPAPGEDDWPSFDEMKPIENIVLTNRDHIRDVELLRTRCAARLVVGADEVTQLAPIAIDEAVREGDLIAGALRVIHLPGEIGLHFDPAHHAISACKGLEMRIMEVLKMSKTEVIHTTARAFQKFTLALKISRDLVIISFLPLQTGA